MDVRRSLLFSAIEKYASFAIGAVSVVALARLLTPEQTGLYAVASGLVAVAQTLREFGIATYLVQEKELTRERLGTALSIALAMGAALSAVFLVSAGHIALFFDGGEALAEIVRLLSVCFLMVPLASISLALMRRRMEFAIIMRIGIAGALAHAAAGIVLAAEGYGAMALAWASVAGIGVSVVLSVAVTRAEIFVRPGLGAWRRVASFGLVSSASLVLAEASNRLPEVVVGRVLGFGASGLYGRAASFVTLFNQTVMHAMGPVAMSGFARLARERADLAGPYRYTLACVTGLAWPMLLSLALMAHSVVAQVFGPQWLPAAPAARLLCLAAGMAALGQVNAIVLNATGNVRKAFSVHGVVVPLQAALVLAAAPSGIEAVAGVAVAVAAARAILSTRHALRVVGVRARGLVAVYAAALGIAAAAGLPGSVTGMLGGFEQVLPWPRLLAVGAATIACWLGAVLLLGHPLGAELRRIARRATGRR